MYYVDEDSDPVFYIHNDIFYIKPTVVNENGGATYYYLPHYTITNWDSGTSKIDNFPPDFYQHVCLYGAIQVIKRRLLDAIDEQPEVIMIPALPIVPTVPTETVLSTPTNVKFPNPPTYNLPTLSIDLGQIKPGAMYWLEEEEDNELVSAYLSIVDKEVTKYEKNFDKAKEEYNAEKAIWDKEVENEIKNGDMRNEHLIRQIDARDKDLAQFGQELSLYQAEIAKWNHQISALEKQFTQNKEKGKERYEWLTSHFQILQLEYEQLFGGGQKPQPQGGK